MAPYVEVMSVCDLCQMLLNLWTDIFKNRPNVVY